MRCKLLVVCLLVGLVGCAGQVVETCGTLPDGSEYCTLVRSLK